MVSIKLKTEFFFFLRQKFEWLRIAILILIYFFILIVD